MPQESVILGVVVEKRQSSSPWIDHRWVPVAVLPGLPDAAPMTLIARGSDFERYYLGSIDLVLTAAETTNYRDNLVSGAPKIWVIMREDSTGVPPILTIVTADPAEGEGAAEAESNLVEAVPMPPEIAAFVADFIARHHVEREFFKRKRDRLDPDGTRRRRVIDETGE